MGYQGKIRELKLRWHLAEREATGMCGEKDRGRGKYQARSGINPDLAEEDGDEFS